MKRGRAGQTTRETDGKCVFAVFSFHEFRSSWSRDFQTHKSKLMCILRLGACKGLRGRWNVGGDGCSWCRNVFHGLGSNFYCQSGYLFIGNLFSHQTPVVSKLKHVRLRSGLPLPGCSTFACSTSPKAWQNKTPDRIIDKTENYPNFAQAEVPLPTSLQLKSLRFSCRSSRRPWLLPVNEIPSFKFEGKRAQNGFRATRKMFYLTFIEGKRQG